MKKSLIAILAVAGLSASANAGLIQFEGWNFTIAYGNGDAVWSARENPGDWQLTQVGGGQGDTPARYRIIGNVTIPGQFSAAWDLELDPDPFVSSFFTVTNLTNGLQPFTVTTTTPSIVVGAPSSMNGSTVGTVGDGDGLQDQFGNGATVRTLVGSPYYEALVDGVGVRTLYPHAQVNSALLGQVNSIALQNFPNEAGPAVLNNIGIRNRFELTPGDNASFTSTFFIIPTPGAAGLAMVAGLAAARRRR